MAKWRLAAKKADFEDMGKTYGIDPVIARIVRNRDRVTPEEIREYLYGDIGDLPSPDLLKGVTEAARLLAVKIKEKKKLRIIGDYDADGICASYILKRGLELCGDVDADIVIPHRIRDGYGINEQLIREACQEGVDTVLTCDNGIAAIEAFDYAAGLGLTCIITDHHEIVYEDSPEGRRYVLPNAAAVIDPRQPGCPYPNKNICGATVAWKLMLKLWEVMEVDTKDREELLELAGFATVCDVMELLGENRILVKEAIRRMGHSGNPGLRALMKVYEIDAKRLSAYHIGFLMGPCLNATGRLDTAVRALELLQCRNEREAVFLASQLKDLNESRKEMTEKGVREGVEQIRRHGWDRDRVMVVYLPDCHESLAGIIAGRLREIYYRPVFVVTRSQEGAKGSARSIESYSLYEEMTKCREMFTKYGGHRQAAGFSIPEERIDDFREKINALCTLQEEDMEEKLLIDVPMPLSYVTRGLIQQLELLEPFGTGNPRPVFAQKEITFLSCQVLGRQRDMARFTVADPQGNRFCLILFRKWEKWKEDAGRAYGESRVQRWIDGNAQDGEDPIVMDISYYPSLNEYMGRSEIQFVMLDWK